MSGEATDGAGADGPELPARFQFSIKTFTGRYLPVEDRLRLDSVDVEGAEQCILLTRRLCNKLIRLPAPFGLCHAQRAGTKTQVCTTGS